MLTALEIQYLVIGFVLAACVTYVAILLFRTMKKYRNCTDYRCSGCAFYDKCKNNQKKVGEKFGGIK